MSDADDARSSKKSPRGARRFERFPFRSRKSSRATAKTTSTFSLSNILPTDGQQPWRPESALDSQQEEGEGELVFGAPSAGTPMSRDGSVSPPSVFDQSDSRPEHETPPTTTRDSDEPGSYDLKPPPPSVSHSNIEALASRFFSADHLDFILRDQNSGPRFVSFLDQYKPQHSKTLRHYIQSKKALIAVDYANAIAEQIPAPKGGPSYMAAALDEDFDAKTRQIAEELVEEALPSYLTHRLVSIVTEILVKEITGNNAPLMREMVPNVAEVYCISDPSLPDNPIVYASDEFYNTSQYGREYVIGRNCRFLQGPKTSDATVRRLLEATNAGEEICETIVNYRRDGTPFMNLLMIAPMYDNKGEARYFLGCQVDVSPLIENGRGLDSFNKLLAQDRAESRFGENRERDPVSYLGELGQMLDEPETDFVLNKVKGGGSNSSSKPASGASTPQKQSSQKRPNNRRILSMDDDVGGKAGSLNALYPDASLGRSGRLPGVYRNYLLVRPYPSLRITFTSPTLRIPGLLQAKFLDRIGGSDHLRDGILQAFQNGTGVTAKVPWLANPKTNGDPHHVKGLSDGRHHVKGDDGKPRWIHCTPLLGSDERVGVWMVVLVENEEVTGLLNRQAVSNNQSQRSDLQGSVKLGPAEKKEAGGDLYADYLKDARGPGRPNTNGSHQTTSTARERREVDAQFRDF